jgi:cell division protein FtsB
MRLFVICALLFVGCSSTEKLEADLAALRARLDEVEEHCRYLEDEQDDISDNVSDLTDGQTLIELQEPEPCQKCNPAEDFPPIFMGPRPPGVAPR